jgi:hypothetical protein
MRLCKPPIFARMPLFRRKSPVDKLQKLLTERSRVSEQFLEDVCVHTRRAAWKASFQTGVTPVWRAYNSASNTLANDQAF